MKARGILLAFWAVSAAMRAEGQSPDWFDAFRGKAFLQGDASFVAREKSAAPDAPPLFRLRWVVIRYGGFSESWRRFWPYRNLLLVTMPSGDRYVLESSMGFLDESHLEEERPWARVASVRVSIEVWSGGEEEPSENAVHAASCEDGRKRVRAPGGTLEFFLDDFGSRTVRAALAEIRVATFDENERRDLSTLLRISVKDNRTLGREFPTYNFRDPILALSIPFLDQMPPPDKRTVVSVPDPAPQGDLASWRALAHLPLDLPPFPALPPDKPIQ